MKLLLITLLLLGSCSLKYLDDVGSKNSAQANRFEFPFKINGEYCRGVKSNLGLCALKDKTYDDLTISIDKKKYSYDLTLTCMPFSFKEEYQVPRNTAFTLDLGKLLPRGEKSFSCTGQVFPHDRDQKISAKFFFAQKTTDPTLEVNVLNKPCLDTRGRLGFCVVHIASDGILKIDLPPKEVAYEIEIECAPGNYRETFNVEAFKAKKLEIPQVLWNTKRSFQCIGRMGEGRFNVFFKVFDGEYQERENIFQLDKYLILGRHSLYVHTNGRILKKRTTLYNRKRTYKQVYTESKVMRYNFYGY